MTASPSRAPGPHDENRSGRGTVTDDTPALKPRRYRGQDPEQRRAERRRRLLDAGLELFGTTGYSGTSVERLCSTSGVTGRHFYEEFPSREALLSAVLDDIVDDCLRRVTDAVAQAPLDLDARVSAGIGAYIRGLTDDPRRARVVTLEAVGVSPEFEQHRRELGRAFADYLRSQARELNESGEQVHGNVFTLQALLAMIHELTMMYLTAAEPIDVQEVIDEAARIVCIVALTPR